MSIEDLDDLLTLSEASALLRWSYDATRRYFGKLPGVLVKTKQRRYKRPYRRIMIPMSVFKTEWQRMANHNNGGVQ